MMSPLGESLINFILKMLSNLAQKREQFILTIKRNAREETFRKNRLLK